MSLSAPGGGGGGLGGRATVTISHTKESDAAHMQKAQRRIVPSNFYPNLDKLTKVYQSFEDSTFNSRNDEVTAAGRITWFTMVKGDTSDRAEAIEKLKDQLFLMFPGMLPEVQVSTENPRWFRVFVSTEDLNMKYFSCKEIVMSRPVFWLLVFLATILFV